MASLKDSILSRKSVSSNNFAYRKVISGEAWAKTESVGVSSSGSKVT
ncbi:MULTISPECIES: hypothetical protein [unclassified Paenibacillus]|nr:MULTISPECIES: hypothetical protein [unclassified Paenibacillus]MBP1157326.1 hypothetical protein [Paenibacillus sp. PvP091]MBP1171935.1 hypothetical protein [Paenibacillus sp. PvR098]MBP2438316.1 hypothetical protein [Paenibacillus sp. PvP052]